MESNKTKLLSKLNDEINGLTKRINNLKAFLEEYDAMQRFFEEPPTKINAEHLRLLNKQLTYMEGYSECLNERWNLLTQKEKEDA